LNRTLLESEAASVHELCYLVCNVERPSPAQGESWPERSLAALQNVSPCDHAISVPIRGRKRPRIDTPSVSRCRTSALLAAPGTAAFGRGTTSRFADTWRLTAGPARWPGPWIGRTSSAALQFYKSRSGRRGEKRRSTAPRERREIRGVPLHTFRRCRPPCRGTWKSPASLRRVCCRAGGTRRVGPTSCQETFSSPASWTDRRCLREGRLPSHAPRGGTACPICRSAIECRRHGRVLGRQGARWGTYRRRGDRGARRPAPRPGVRGGGWPRLRSRRRRRTGCGRRWEWTARRRRHRAPSR